MCVSDVHWNERRTKTRAIINNFEVRMIETASGHNDSLMWNGRKKSEPSKFYFKIVIFIQTFFYLPPYTWILRVFLTELFNFSLAFFFFVIRLLRLRMLSLIDTLFLGLLVSKHSLNHFSLNICDANIGRNECGGSNFYFSFFLFLILLEIKVLFMADL